MNAVGGFENDEIGDVSDDEERDGSQVNKILNRIEADKFAHKIKFDLDTDRKFVLNYALSKTKIKIALTQFQHRTNCFINHENYFDMFSMSNLCESYHAKKLFDEA